MTIVRFNHPGLLSQLADEALYRNVFDSHLDFQHSCVEKGHVHYRMNDQEKEISLEFAIPGLTKEDITIELNNQVLSIKTKNEEGNKENIGKFTPAFEKHFKLSDKVKPDEISAHTENGILYVMIPKADEAVKKPARAIEIA